MLSDHWDQVLTRHWKRPVAEEALRGAQAGEGFSAVQLRRVSRPLFSVDKPCKEQSKIISMLVGPSPVRNPAQMSLVEETSRRHDVSPESQALTLRMCDVKDALHRFRMRDWLALWFELEKLRRGNVALRLKTHATRKAWRGSLPLWCSDKSDQTLPCAIPADARTWMPLEAGIW